MRADEKPHDLPFAAKSEMSLILRSDPKGRVSKDEQRASCSSPPFETRSCGPLLRVRLFCPSVYGP